MQIITSHVYVKCNGLLSSSYWQFKLVSFNMHMLPISQICVFALKGAFCDSTPAVLAQTRPSKVTSKLQNSSILYFSSTNVMMK